MELVHTLLFFVRESTLGKDLMYLERCLDSLSRSRFKTVVVYNQGFWRNADVESFLAHFPLDAVVLGDGQNMGTVVGRQRTFEAVYTRFPSCAFISELHPDMVFASDWETPLVDYLKTHDEPVISCGIVSDPAVYLLEREAADEYLAGFRRDEIARGFTLPCIHQVKALQAVGGYDARFLHGKQAFEDDSLLLGYHYYYGTRANWHPKINYNSVVFHAVGGQRFDAAADLFQNFDGLLMQYGAMGIHALSALHVNPWQKNFFTGKFEELLLDKR